MYCLWVPPSPGSHPTRPLWRARFPAFFTIPMPLPHPAEFHMLKAGEAKRPQVMLSLCGRVFFLRAGRGDFKTMLRPNPAESDLRVESWHGFPPGGSNILRGENPAKQQPKLLPAGIMLWLGEGHIHSSEDWLDVSQSSLRGTEATGPPHFPPPIAVVDNPDPPFRG